MCPLKSATCLFLVYLSIFISFFKRQFFREAQENEINQIFLLFFPIYIWLISFHFLSNMSVVRACKRTSIVTWLRNHKQTYSSYNLPFTLCSNLITSCLSHLLYIWPFISFGQLRSGHKSRWCAMREKFDQSPGYSETQSDNLALRMFCKQLVRSRWLVTSGIEDKVKKTRKAQYTSVLVLNINFFVSELTSSDQSNLLLWIKLSFESSTQGHSPLSHSLTRLLPALMPQGLSQHCFSEGMRAHQFSHLKQNKLLIWAW